MSKFLCSSQSKCSPQPTCLSFRKSSDSSRNQNRNRDADTHEARRKAAASAWHERAGGEVVPTRARGVENSAAVSRHSNAGEVIPTRPRSVETVAAVSKHSRVDRTASLFNIETTKDTGGHKLSSKPTNGPATNLFDACELSSLAQQIALFAQRLQEKSGLDNFRAQFGDSDELTWRGLDHTSTTHRPASEKPFTRHRRSFSDPTAPRQFSHETRGSDLGIERNVGHSDSKAEGDFSRTGFANVRRFKKSSLRKSVFLLQKLCRKMISIADDDSYSERSTGIHHFHHHYHFYHYQTDPDVEELRILERGKGRKHSENFTPYTERRFADPEAQISTADMAAAYWASIGDRVTAAQGGKTKIHSYDHRFSSDESLLSAANISKDRALRRRSENFDRSADKAHGSSADLEAARIRRHTADIGPSFRSWAGNG